MDLMPCGTKEYRINGQHTAWLRVILDDGKLREELTVREIYYRAGARRRF